MKTDDDNKNSDLIKKTNAKSQEDRPVNTYHTKKAIYISYKMVGPLTDIQEPAATCGVLNSALVQG